MLSLEAANELIWKKFKHLPVGYAEVDVLEGIDRIVAEDIVSNVNVPDFSRSMCDGYAVQAGDISTANEDNPVLLEHLGEVASGEKATMEVKKGQCAYVSTGSMMPAGADAVIMVEQTKVQEKESVLVFKSVIKGERMILRGDDLKAGQIIIKRGERLSPRHVGALVAAGIYEVKVFTRPRFAIISTGDELVDIGQEPAAGQIRETNSYALQAFITKAGGEVVRRVLVRDDRKLYRQELEIAVECADIVLISGGCSVGIRDFTADVINSLPGEGVFIQGVAIRPGRPLIVGECMGKPVFGLPGHPIAPVLLFKIVIEKLWHRLYGCLEEDVIRAVVDFDMSPSLYTHLLVQLEKGEEFIKAKPANLANPAQTSAISRSNGYIWIKDSEAGLCRGQIAEVFSF
ncbi:MAG: molybdopterin molybdotransferase MoeA [Syntrophomonadaceae bacterium]|nr:molybdopterin molybdotransferase MoeA [Syntrophomonadaceae bacterium]